MILLTATDGSGKGVEMSGSVRELLELAYERLASGQGVADLIQHDALLLGTETAEWWEGRQAVLAALETQDASIGRPRITRDGDLRVREHGDVAWFAEHATLRFGNDDLRVRLTGVAVRDSNGWLLAQFQAAPLDDDEDQQA